MSPFPLSGALPGILANTSPIVEDTYPDADRETSNWSSTPLWQKIDDKSTADFIGSSSCFNRCGVGSCTYDFEVDIATPSGTVADGDRQGLQVYVQVRRVDDSGTGHDADMTVILREGATTRKSATFNNLGTGWSSKVLTLSAAEVDAIGNHANLRVDVSITMCTALDFDSVSADCSSIYLRYYAR